MTRREKIRVMVATIANLKQAIAKHGPTDGYIRSLVYEQDILEGFLDGRWDENGEPFR